MVAQTVSPANVVLLSTPNLRTAMRHAADALAVFLVALFLSSMLGLVLPPAGASAQTVDSLTIAGLRWRGIGPAFTGGRVSDVVGIPGPSATLYVGAAAGGVWKTTNNGVTWRPLFDDKAVASMGALAIAPSDTMQIWAGTGEQNSRYPIEPGGGIFKSADGGETWTLMGLEETQHIGRIVVHPTNPDIVYVAALGALYGPNPERGLYKTTDGGRTWRLSKFVDDRTGFVDLAMDPRDPNVLYAAAYQRRRTPYSLESGGPGSGLWKTTDGGETWTEIEGPGWPTGVKGRIGIGIAPSDGDIVYALVEAARPQPGGGYVPEYHAAPSGLYRSDDAGPTWRMLNDYNDRPFYYSQVRVDPRDPEKVFFSSSPFQMSVDGGKTYRSVAQGVHIDTHGMWIDPSNPDRWAIVDDGGFSITFDGGGNFFSPMNLPLTQFYRVGLDDAIPYNVCGGSQDNGTECGPSRRRSGTVTNADWMIYQGGDATYALQDPTDPDVWYTETVSGNLRRYDLATGEQVTIHKPHWEAVYQRWEDSIAKVRGNPLTPPSPGAASLIRQLRAEQQQDSLDLDIRFGWDAALLVSSHSPATIYWGGSRLLKSTNRGDNLTIISPDLTKKLYAQIDTSRHRTGGVNLETTQTELFGYIVSLAESPVRPGLLYVGTDDGNVWRTPDDGRSWENLTSRMPGLPGGTPYISGIEASHFDTLTFYVAVDNHRQNDDKPYLYATHDGGRTFRAITDGLPSDGHTNFLHVVREDPYNPNLIFVGSSSAVYVSSDRGASWTRFMTGMPTVPVFDLKIHARDRELVAGTHGRSFWIVDIAPLEDLTPDALSSASYLFPPKTSYQWTEPPARGNTEGQAAFEVGNPPYGAPITYRLASPVEGQVLIGISNAMGETLATISGPGTTGLHTVVWDYQIPPAPEPPPPLSPSIRRDSILAVQRAPMVFDSLIRAGWDTVDVQRVRELIAPIASGGSRQGGRRGGGRGAPTGETLQPCHRPLTQWDPFCPRPGEGPFTVQPRTSQGPFTSPTVVHGANPDKVLEIFQIIGISYFNTEGRSFLGSGNDTRPGPEIAEPGDYVVTLETGGEMVKRPLRVERAPEVQADSRQGGR